MNFHAAARLSPRQAGMSGILRITVILPCESGSGLVSDLLSTLIYIGGTENAEHYAEICGESFEDYGIITIDNSGNVTSYGSVDIVK